MKNDCLSNFKNHLVLIELLAIFFLLFSCQQDMSKKDDYKEIVKKTEIIPEFEQFAPIPTKIELELLEPPRSSGENVRAVVAFEPKSFGSDYFALNVGETKVTLRDDGKGADRVAKDAKFSIFLKEDIDILVERLDGQKKLILSNDAPSFTFEGRMAIPINKESIRNFDMSMLVVNGVVEIPEDILFPNLPVVSHENSLTITAPEVVEDPERTFDPCTQTGNPNGVWTFGSLMRQMASPNPTLIASDAMVSDFVINWLKTWDQNVMVNDQIVNSRGFVKDYLLEPWLQRSLIAGAPSGQLKMEFAPFKLNAIVNRLDLRGNSGYGFSNAGEGRFLFTFIPPGICYKEFGPNGPGIPTEGVFNVILEYGINKRKCTDIKAFAQEWADLTNMVLGSNAYNKALENITNQFTQCGSSPSKPQQSSINQVRTNDFLGEHSPWELREFRLTESGNLGMVPVQMEPSTQFNSQSSTISHAASERFATYVNSHSVEIGNNIYVVPEKIPATHGIATPTIPFLGGLAINPDSGLGPEKYWDGTSTMGPSYIVDDKARHIFSLNTCSGCHSLETNTDFVQINSGFLTGITVADPASRPTGNPKLRTFNDLARREMDLTNLLNKRCFDFGVIDLSQTLLFKPINMTH